MKYLVHPVLLAFVSCSCAKSNGGEKASADACQGWSCKVSKKIWKEFGERSGYKSSYCDIPVLDASSISHDVYNNKSLKDTAFLLRKGSTLQEHAFEKHHLLKAAKRKKLSVKIGQSWNIVRNNGRGAESILFNDYVKNMMHAELFDETDEQVERTYVFDDFSELFGLKGTNFSTPDIMDSWLSRGFTKLDFSKSANPVLLLGASWSGVSFHRHAAAIQMMAIGYKRWFLYPPSSSPPGGDHGAWPVYDWYHNVYPNLKDEQRPLECIQKPGDAIWIPELWYHATLNLADSVAITAQHRAGESEGFHLQRMWAQTSRGHGVKYLEDLLKLEPENLGAIVDLAVEIKDEDPKKALKLLRGVWKKDPWQLDALVMMASFLEQRAGNGDKKARKELLQILQASKPVLEKNPRTVSSIRLLETYYKLIGNQPAAGRMAERRSFLVEGGSEEWDFNGAFSPPQDGGILQSANQAKKEL